MHVLRTILASPLENEPTVSLDAWWQRHRSLATRAPLSINHAILGGYLADRVGYAFASGYQAALRVLVPDLSPDQSACLCVTERGGGHPRAIESRLVPDGPGVYRVKGRKRWAMRLSDAASLLLVLASEGTGPDGTSRLRLVRVESTSGGVLREPMPPSPFVPEIAHDEVSFDDVRVAEADLYPGDGFTRYVRPFRTIEDIHVFAAVLAYVLREARIHALPHSLSERLAGLLVGLRALAVAESGSPEHPIALAGLIDLAAVVLADLEAVWSKTESPAYARWARDRVLLLVATSARDKRRARAWKDLEAAFGN